MVCVDGIWVCVDPTETATLTVGDTVAFTCTIDARPWFAVSGEVGRVVLYAEAVLARIAMRIMATMAAVWYLSPCFLEGDAAVLLVRSVSVFGFMFSLCTSPRRIGLYVSLLCGKWMTVVEESRSVGVGL